MRIHMIERRVLIEPVRLLPPPTQHGFLYIPATAIEPHPHIGRLACHNQKLHDEEGLEEGDLVVFSLEQTHFEMPFQGAILLVVDVCNLSGKVELEEGWSVVPMSSPMPQELAPAFKPFDKRQRAANKHAPKAQHSRSEATTSPATPRALEAANASGLAEQTNPETPALVLPTDAGAGAPLGSFFGLDMGTGSDYTARVVYDQNGPLVSTSLDVEQDAADNNTGGETP